MGPVIPPGVNASMAMLVRLFEENFEPQICCVCWEPGFCSAVREPICIRRHLCMESIAHWSNVASEVADLYPNYRVIRRFQPISTRSHDDLTVDDAAEIYHSIGVQYC
ncbi:hypothetical protein ABZP36_006089 [Zizania latifolia]